MVKEKIKHNFLTVTLLVWCSVLAAQKTNVPDYQVKAVFIFNFTQFVEWPANALPPDQIPFIIGILGDNPFGTYLEEVISGEKVNGHPLVLKYYKSVSEIKTCQILYISKSEDYTAADVMEILRGKSVLTIGETPNFLQNGGIIRFFTKNNKIQIQINLDTAKSENLVISSKLLKIAEIFVLAKKN